MRLTLEHQRSQANYIIPWRSWPVICLGLAISMAAIAAVLSHFFHQGFRIELGSVGEWLVTLAVGVAIVDSRYRLTIEEAASKRRRLRVLSEALTATDETVRKVEDARRRFDASLRRLFEGYAIDIDHRTEKVICRPIPMLVVTTEWKRAYRSLRTARRASEFSTCYRISWNRVTCRICGRRSCRRRCRGKASESTARCRQD